MSQSWSRMIVAASVVLSSTLARAQYEEPFDAPVCDPCSVSSVDGAWSVRLEPQDSRGQGWTLLDIARSGNRAATGRIGVFPLERYLTRAGTLAGWGWTGDPAKHLQGELHVVIVDSDGQVLLDEKTCREMPPPTCCAVEPEDDPTVYCIQGMHCVEEADVLLVRFTDGRSWHLGEEWRPYRLSTGEALERRRPKMLLAAGDSLGWVLASRIVPGTPLILTQWTSRGPDEDWGFRWVLCNVAAEPVWELDLPRDISGIGDNGYQVFEELTHSPDGGILGMAERTFELRLCAKAKRARYGVSQGTNGAWKVELIEETDLEAAPVPTARPEPQPAPRQPAEHLGVIDLTAHDPPRSEVHDVVEFGIDGPSRLVLVRRVTGEDAFEVVRVQSDGRWVHTLRLPAREEEGRWSGEVCWIHDDRAIAVWEAAGHRAWLFEVSLREGTLLRLNQFPGHECRQIERTPDGGFCVLDEEALQAFDAECKLLWRRTYDDKLCGGDRLAIDAAGQIFVIDHVYRRNMAVQRISPSGRIGAYTPIQDLPAEHGTSLFTDSRGGWWMPGETGWSHIDESGSCADPIVVKGPNGTPLDTYRMRACEDRSYWALHRGGLVHLTSDLKVDRVLGDATDTQALREAQTVDVDAHGRVSALCERTADVFQFDEAGALLRVVRAEPADFPHGAADYDTRLWVQPDGSMVVGEPDRGYVQFDPAGRRRGVRGSLAHPDRRGQVGTGRSWLVDEAVTLVDSEGSVVRKTERGEDDRWLLAWGGGAAAEDGTLAVFVRIGDRQREEQGIATFDHDGRLLHVWPIGRGFTVKLAWDGRHAAFIVDSEVNVLDTSTGATKKLSLSAPGFNVQFSTPIFLVHEGREIWLFDGRTKIHRFAMPRFE